MPPYVATPGKITRAGAPRPAVSRPTPGPGEWGASEMLERAPMRLRPQARALPWDTGILTR
jgi:hypothetical protein